MKGKHQSLDKSLKNNIFWIENLSEVKKVIIGYSESCRHRYSPGSIRFKIGTASGIKVFGYSGNGITDIYIKIYIVLRINFMNKLIRQKFYIF